MSDPTITAAMLAEWRATCEAATLGEWQSYYASADRCDVMLGPDDEDSEPEDVLFGPRSGENWSFILAARRAMPLLIAEVERLRAELSRERAGVRQRDAAIMDLRTEQDAMRQEIGPQVPQLPPGAIEFAKELGQLAGKYNFRSVVTKVEFERTTSGDSATVEVAVSNVDGRGRPRTKIVVMGEVKIRHVVEWQPDTTD